jgi:hypothetical protein
VCHWPKVKSGIWFLSVAISISPPPFCPSPQGLPSQDGWRRRRALARRVTRSYGLGLAEPDEHEYRQGLLLGRRSSSPMPRRSTPQQRSYRLPFGVWSLRDSREAVIRAFRISLSTLHGTTVRRTTTFLNAIALGNVGLPVALLLLMSSPLLCPSCCIGPSAYLPLHWSLSLKKLIDIDKAHTLCALLLCIYTRKQATITRQKRKHILFLSEVFWTLTLRYFVLCRRYFRL